MQEILRELTLKILNLLTELNAKPFLFSRSHTSTSVATAITNKWAKTVEGVAEIL